MTNPQAQALGDAIRRRRRSIGLTLVQVAQVSGLSHPFLSQLERGRTRGSMRSLFLVAEALGTSQQALLAEASPADDSVPVMVAADGGATMPGEAEAGTARLLAGLPGQVALTEFCLPPRAFGAFYVHQHQEVLYLVAGSLEVELAPGPAVPDPVAPGPVAPDGRADEVRLAGAAQRYLLGPRDTLRCPGGVPHRFRAVGPATSVFLLIHPLA